MTIERNNRTQRDCKQPQKHKCQQRYKKIQRDTKQPQTHNMTSECGSSHSQRSERTRSGPSQVSGSVSCREIRADQTRQQAGGRTGSDRLGPAAFVCKQTEWKPPEAEMNSQQTAAGLMSPSSCCLSGKQTSTSAHFRSEVCC